MSLSTMIRFLLPALFCCAATAAAAAEPAPPVAAIPSLDVPRYMGTWYEIAKYPNRFQKQCASSTTATYTLEPDKTVRVVNRCLRADGRPDTAVGSARQVGAPTSAVLQVRFAPAWLSFLPMVWGDYWVVDLDPDYTLAAVSEPKREYLWILARTPAVPRAAYDALLARLRSRGFDLEKLEATRQAE
ncbi:lipocalin family protein [uncultured Massilia sp.]|uniref:lipocalin family protein n=1 Tax=uncultured Massilia sp. TaxID=169973 RepID=UPI0025DD960D|nr:lipocalin family protein [uncultured Massilia sp.]